MLIVPLSILGQGSSIICANNPKSGKIGIKNPGRDFCPILYFLGYFYTTVSLKFLVVIFCFYSVCPVTRYVTILLNPDIIDSLDSKLIKPSAPGYFLTPVN